MLTIAKWFRKKKNKNLILNKNFLLSSKIFDEKLVLNLDADFRSNNFFKISFPLLRKFKVFFVVTFLQVLHRIKKFVLFLILF